MTASWTSVPGTAVCRGGLKADPPHLGKRKVDEVGWCRDCHYARRRHKRTLARASSVRRLYGLSETDLAALLKHQHGRCACGRRMNVTKAANVDHWHGCPHCGGKGCRRCVRGLLCGPCNTYLGYIGDRRSALLGLLWHVDAWPAQGVLTALDRGATMETSAGI